MTLNRPSVDSKRLAHLRLITQDTRAQMLCLIRGHPQQLPSLVELDALLDEHKSTLYEHMGLLIDAGLVTRYTDSTAADGGTKTPYVFYGLTATGYQLLRTSTVFSDATVLETEFTQRAAAANIEEYTTLPRPREAVDTVIELNTVGDSSE